MSDIDPQEFGEISATAKANADAIRRTQRELRQAVEKHDGHLLDLLHRLTDLERCVQAKFSTIDRRIIIGFGALSVAIITGPKAMDLFTKLFGF